LCQHVLHHSFALRVCTGYSKVGHSPLFLYYELLLEVKTKKKVFTSFLSHDHLFLAAVSLPSSTAPKLKHTNHTSG